MSLKSKIEAVIYASEEPVTLTQLVGLLGEEAQAELDRAELELRQQQLELATEAAADAAVTPEGETVAAPETDGDAEAAVSSEADGEAAVEAPTAEETVPPAEVASEAASPEAMEARAEETAATGSPTEPETDGKKKKLSEAEKQATRRLREHFRKVLDELMAEYVNNDRGLEIREVAGGYRFATKPEYHDAVRGFIKSLKPPLKLSLPALETLAVIAYKQPVTAPEISEVRGVDSGGVLGSLMARKLITTSGRKQVIGRPMLYKTTKDFLLRFGLKDISELPSIEEFEKMAGELAEQEDIPMGDPVTEHETAVGTNDAPNPDHENLAMENAVEPQADGGGDIADEVVVDGRVSGLDPDYQGEDAADDPSAQEAAEQEQQKEGVE